MTARTVREVLRNDRWSFREGQLDCGPYNLRFRTPVLGPDGVGGYGRVFRVLWLYAAEQTSAMPASDDSEEMKEFENRLCAALEVDTQAFLAAVLTFDGARQWVFYTDNVAECGRRLEAMPQNDGPYPIELDAFDDPTWKYVRNEVLRISAHDA